MKIRKAIVLAAGHGTRLRPFTCATPKPLMPVWGEPMLGRIVAMLRSWGVDDIAFNTHCLHEQVKAWADGYRRGAVAAGDKVKVKVSYEPEILGTGGVLNPLREWIEGEPFYLVNGDIVVENARTGAARTPAATERTPTAASQRSSRRFSTSSSRKGSRPSSPHTRTR